MKTFQEFLDEGKKKIEKLSTEIQKNIKKDIKRQKKENPNKPPVADYGNPKLGSDEHMAAIHPMMARDSAWRKKMRKKMGSEEH